jgi:hypothetical protein
MWRNHQLDRLSPTGTTFSRDQFVHQRISGSARLPRAMAGAPSRVTARAFGYGSDVANSAAR